MNKSNDKMKFIIIAGVACVVAIALIAIVASSLSGGSVKAVDGAVPAVRTSESVEAQESESVKQAEEAKETETDVAASLKDQIDYDYLTSALAYIDMTYEASDELKEEDYSGYPTVIGYLTDGLATRAGKDGKDYIEENADALPQIIEDDQFQAIVDPNSDLTADYTYGYINATYRNTCFDKFLNLIGCEDFNVGNYLSDYYNGGSYIYDVTNYSRKIYSEVTLGTIDTDKNAVYVHYKYTPDVTDNSYEDEYLVAVIVPAQNTLGYQITAVSIDDGDVSYDLEESEEDDETETDIYGNVIEKESEEETDIYGNVIEEETEEETDIYGNVIEEDDDNRTADYNDGDYHSSTTSSSGSNSRNPFSEDSSSGSGMIGFNGSLGNSNSSSSDSYDYDYDDDYDDYNSYYNNYYGDYYGNYYGY